MHHERLGQRHQGQGFRQEEDNQWLGRRLLARQLKLMHRRGMGLMLTVVMIVLIRVIVVVIHRLGAGRRTVAVMHLRQEVKRHIMDVERKQSGRQQAKPPPDRGRAGWQHAWLT